MHFPKKIYCLEIKLMPLSELIVRQVGKSNVRWFTYPFIPPTTFSGFLHSVIFDDEPNNFIEKNDANVRRLEDKFEGVYCLGAYPPIINGKVSVQIDEHYRQHLGDKFNYESFIWNTQSQNKKLAIVEHFWTDILRGFIISENKDILKDISAKVYGRISRIGKKGSIQIIESSIYTLNMETDGMEWCSTFAPVEIVSEFPIDSKIYTIPVSSQKGSKKKPSWKLLQVMIGVKIFPPYYKELKNNIVFPVKIFDILKQ
jgi:hypothetical protein